ncbi:hypothetical protein [Chryseolinea lacunae]|uniref:Galactose oxidase n=1 Tax=Chryseolinea lacunae TaxID=2801331 RepID=A0ABS1KTY1_9BACT|nr:hypothetical protein [Chryseolinea lacunae]MBL0742890.1 hypothetical protein [Chryseolinea lacunae]
MKKSVLFLVISFLFSCAEEDKSPVALSATTDQGQWTARTSAPMVGDETNITFFSTQGKGFVLFGQQALDGAPQDATFYVFDPAGNSWSPKTIYDKNFSPVQHVSWAATAGKGFVLEPYGGDLHAYDVATDTWSIRKNPYINGQTDLYPVTAFGIGDNGFVLLSDNTLWKYDYTADRWESQGTFPATFNDAYTIDGSATETKGYITNGPSVWEFDPSSTQWKATTKFPGAASIAFATEGHLYAGDYAAADKGLWQFDAAGNRWERVSTLAGNARYAAFHVGIGNKGYVGLGVLNQSDELVKDFFEYTPATGQ